MLHGRRDQRREERRNFGRGGSATVYQVREKMLSIGDDMWIENGDGERIYKIDGKAMRLRKTLVFEDTEGRELCRIKERVLRVRDSMEVEDPDGERLAMVKKAMITPLRERWVVERPDRPDLRVKGNVLDHEYEIEEDGTKVAEISKRWFRVRDTYGVEIAPGQNDVIVLAVTAAIDSMTHDRG
jgi:uncharacterized protein YxjI